MKTITRKAAIARLRRHCTKIEEILHINRSALLIHEFGECYVSCARYNSLIQNGSIEELMEDRGLLKDYEIIEVAS